MWTYRECVWSMHMGRHTVTVVLLSLVDCLMDRASPAATCINIPNSTTMTWFLVNEYRSISSQMMIKRNDFQTIKVSNVENMFNPTSTCSTVDGPIGLRLNCIRCTFPSSLSAERCLPQLLGWPGGPLKSNMGW